MILYNPPQRAAIIDDTRAVQILIAHVLHAAGFETRTASDGYTGWQLVRTYQPDLVITDLDMPCWGGWQLIEAVRSTPLARLDKTPIIVCSATDDWLSIRESFDAGASYFIKKPIDVRQLSDLIDQIFNEPGRRMSSNAQRLT